MPGPVIVTIDGPSGTGKSTAAQNLARHLGFLYLDTGAMYRAVALKAMREGICLEDKKGLTRLAKRTRIGLKGTRARGVRVFLDGSDVTRAIRAPRVSQAASLVATLRGVRRALVAKQRAIAAGASVVAEGRDTGTVVFRKADLKVFLTASLAERSRRRFEELKRAGHRVTLAEVVRQTRARDRRDRRRAASPLKPAPGALRIDNTRLKSSQVFDKLSDYVKQVQKKALLR
ncbi:MAG: (d)CMP kinase [Candidatus Omnitrophica bacterium]|nr:(d)CMP kinase [Candidatus Omnitrophota bacterium]